MPRVSSNFSVAAKILFDSAQKVGAVGHLSKSGSTYSRKAQKIFASSKFRNGSLNSVSLKVSKFLETQRIDPATPERIVGLEIPSFSLAAKGNNKEENVKSKSGVLFPKSLNKEKKNVLIHFSVDMKKNLGSDLVKETEILRKTGNYSDRSLESIAKESESVVDAELHSATSSGLKLPTRISEQLPVVESTPEKSSIKIVSRTKLILEDQPLFVSSNNATLNSVGGPILVSSLPEVAASITEAKRPSDSLSTGSFVDDAKSFILESKKEDSNEVSSLTVDAWEQQRTKELERLEKIRLAEEKRRELVQQEEKHRILGNEWVAKRSRVMSIIHNPMTRALTEITKLKASESIKKLNDIVKAGRSEAIISTAVAIIWNKLAKESVLDRIEGKRKILEIIEKEKSLMHLVQKVRLKFSSKKEFLSIYRSLSKTEQECLDYNLKKKVVRRLTIEGFWEDALSLLSSDKQSSSRKYGLEVSFLRSLLYTNPAIRAKVLESGSEMFHGSEASGKEKRLLLILLEKNPVRKSLLKQAIDSADVDEETYSALICASNESETRELLDSMERKGLNSEDLCVKRALLRKLTMKEEPSAVLNEIEKQKKNFSLRPFHLAAAIKAVKKDPSSLDRVVELIREMHPEQSLWPLKKVLPKLYELNMFDNIVALCDHFHKYAPLDKVLPQGVAFYNSALLQVGREPVSQLSVQDIDYVSETKKGGEKGKLVDAEEAVDITLTTELMLDYAKSKNWQKALEAVESLPLVLSESKTASLVLLFNCALSASVDQVEVVQKIYALMKKRSVEPNTTTVNTILSSFSRASLVIEIADFLKEIPLGIRDNNSYLIYFTLLAKKNMYSEIVVAFDEGRKAGIKYPISSFAIVLSVTVNHSWESTLRIFQDLIKAHGKDVNETIKAQVLSCLNKNGRTSEVRKLMKQLDTKKKKR